MVVAEATWVSEWFHETAAIWLHNPFSIYPEPSQPNPSIARSEVDVSFTARISQDEFLLKAEPTTIRMPIQILGFLSCTKRHEVGQFALNYLDIKKLKI